MAEPCLQLEQRHGIAAVEELAGNSGKRTVARDGTAHVAGVHAVLAAEHRDDRLVDHLPAHGTCSMREEQLDLLASLAVDTPRLRQPNGLPCLYGLAHLRIDGLGEVGPGLVDRDIKHADGSGRRISYRLLPPHAADAETADLITSQAGEEPDERDGADVLQRVGVALDAITTATR